MDSKAINIILSNINQISSLLDYHLEKIEKYNKEGDQKKADKQKNAMVKALDNLIASAEMLKSELKKS